MSELKDLLDGEVADVGPEPSGFERTMRLVERRQRSKRMSAGALGLLLTLVIVAGLWGGLGRGSHRPPAETASGAAAPSSSPSPTGSRSAADVKLVPGYLPEDLKYTGDVHATDPEGTVYAQKFTNLDPSTPTGVLPADIWAIEVFWGYDDGSGQLQDDSKLSGAEAITVNGSSGVLLPANSDRGLTTVEWMQPDGLFVQVVGRNIDQNQVVQVAQGLRA